MSVKNMADTMDAVSLQTLNLLELLLFIIKQGKLHVKNPILYFENIKDSVYSTFINRIKLV